MARRLRLESPRGTHKRAAVVFRHRRGDAILTQASLYWFKKTISTSFRPYYEYRHTPPAQVRVTVPTAVAVFPGDLVHPPRSWAERSYSVTRYTEMAHGGHFAALEQPELLAQDIREFVRELPESLGR